MPTPTLTLITLTHSTSPESGLIADADGDLFGATLSGTIFELPYNGGAYASATTTLATFTNGQTDPLGPLAIDSNGNLLGTTFGAGANNLGSVFELARTPGGYASTPTVVASFNNNNGVNPDAGLIIDAAGNLVGTTSYTGMGITGYGTIFEVASTTGGYASTPTTLITFNDADGAYPEASLIADPDGNLFGVTYGGGSAGVGTVFEIPFVGGGYASTPTTLATLNGATGEHPEAGLMRDSAGDLFGTTGMGGQYGDGTVFEIVRTGGLYASTPTTLVSFWGGNGAGPRGVLIEDSLGNLFGTTDSGGTGGDGTVFEIPFISGRYASVPTTLLNFDGTNGASPLAGLTADAAGNLFGTTQIGGPANGGKVFELSNAGYGVEAVACYMRGTRVATPVGERAIEALAAGDHVLTESGEMRSIVRIVRRHIDCDSRTMPEKVWPVLVRAGGFGDRLPRRDLWLSPDHAVFVDGVLIPIKYLVNGVTIERVSRSEVTYYHIELPGHDVILAEGLPAESYFDTGDGFGFDDGGARRSGSTPSRWESEGYAPLVVGGPRLRKVRQRINSLFVAAEPTTPRWQPEAHGRDTARPRPSTREPAVIGAA